MSGTLYVVATPIGNLEDVTLRALRILREVAVVAAEDTRRTAKLLQHYSIATPTLSYHEHSGPARARDLLRRLEAGESVALVSDAGTPGVSDPGYELIRGALGRGIPVEPVPGASAGLAALVASGFPMERFTVAGFAPARAKDRKQWLDALCKEPAPVVFFETPHRIGATLADLDKLCGKRPITVARELTKLHQEFLRGTAAEVLARLTRVKGEFTIVLGPAPNVESVGVVPADEEIATLFGEKTKIPGFDRRQATGAVASELGLPANIVYEAVERHKSLGKQEK